MKPLSRSLLPAPVLRQFILVQKIFCLWVLTAGISFAGNSDRNPVRVASMNLCADVLLLELADPQQIVSVSALSIERRHSSYVELASQYPINHGNLEELIPLAPDLVLLGTHTTATSNPLLSRLSFEVIAIAPDQTLEQYRQNLRLVGSKIGQSERAELLISKFDNALQARVTNLRDNPRLALIYQANGFSPGTGTLANALLLRSGLVNLTAQLGITGGTFLTLEHVIQHQPMVMINTYFDERFPALAGQYANHRAFRHPTSKIGDAWNPIIINLPERYWNCGSQHLPTAIDHIRSALASFDSR